jgi:hypothetical protein
LYARSRWQLRLLLIPAVYAAQLFRTLCGFPDGFKGPDWVDQGFSPVSTKRRRYRKAFQKFSGSIVLRPVSFDAVE